MKKLVLASAVALVCAGAFAQALVAPEGRGPGMRGQGPIIDWKPGTLVTTEYKTLAGTVTRGTTGPATLRAEGVDYLLLLPRRAPQELKSGDAVSVEGPVTVVKSDTQVQPFIQAFKITLNGKEIDLRQGRSGFGEDDGPPDGNDPFGQGAPRRR